MAEEPVGRQEGHEAEATPDEVRDDWFARQLGEEWVEIEPGIYRQVLPDVPVEPQEPAELDEEALDRSLLRAVPAESEAEHSEEAPAERGRWWRRH